MYAQGSDNIIGIFSSLKAKYENNDKLIRYKPILVEVSQKGWMSTYMISWGEISISGRSSLKAEELRTELKKESRRVKDISVLFEEDVSKLEKENRDSDEFWKEHFMEDGAFMRH